VERFCLRYIHDPKKGIGLEEWLGDTLTSLYREPCGIRRYIVCYGELNDENVYMNNLTKGKVVYLHSFNACGFEGR